MVLETVLLRRSLNVKDSLRRILVYHGLVSPQYTIRSHYLGVVNA